MQNFMLLGHLDTFAVMSKLFKLKPSTWPGVEARCELGDPRLPSRSLLLRRHDDLTQENWIEDLPLHDAPELQEWVSMQRLLDRAHRIIAAHPVFQRAIDWAAQRGRAMLTVLPRSTTVLWHEDNGPYHKAHQRFHIPLVTNPGCTAYSGNEMVHMPVGSLWWFNNHVTHSVVNFGEHNRIHLIFELRTRAAAPPTADEPA